MRWIGWARQALAISISFNTPLEMPMAKLACQLAGDTCQAFNTPLEMLRLLLPSCRWCLESSSFNTPLEMPRPEEPREHCEPAVFQYSIGDAQHQKPARRRLDAFVFQYSIGDAEAIFQGRTQVKWMYELSILHWRCRRRYAAEPPSRHWHLSILHWRCWGFLCLVFVGF